MHSQRASLLGQHPSDQFGQPTTDIAQVPQSRRVTLLPTGPPVAPTIPPPSRRTILENPSGIPPQAETESWTPPPSILDRPVGLLDRTATEKQYNSGSGLISYRNVPLLSHPTPNFDYNGVIAAAQQLASIQQYDNGECGGTVRRGILDRSRTNSPHSVRSSISPAGSLSNSHLIAGQGLLDRRQGLLDRHSLSPPPTGRIVNESGASWASLNSGGFRNGINELRGRSHSRSPSQSRRHSRWDERKDSRPPSSLSQASGHLESRKRKRTRSNSRSDRSISRDRKIGNDQCVKAGILDRSSEEKR